MKNNLKIVIGCDHAAIDMKKSVIELLEKLNYEVTDVGAHTTDACDYPDIAHALCEKIMSGECHRGFLICGTGIGMSLAANKHPGIRAACCSDLYSAELTRRHNDTNVLCFGARVIDVDQALRLAEIFVTTDFEADSERHVRRVAKMAEIEKQYMNGEVK